MDKKPVEKKAAKKPAPQAPTRDLLDVLLDQNNKDPIVLMDENGRQITFEQVAIIPYEADGKERKLYVVLKPIDKIEGINDDEAIVFVCEQDKNGRTVLRVEENEEIAIAVFDKFYDLLEESAKARKAKKAATKPAAKTAAKPATKTATKTAAKPTTTKTTATKTAAKTTTTAKTAAKPAAKAPVKTAGKTAGKKTK